ncbi:MAG: hypothetical protein ACE5I2_07345 [Anaerolineae bacterium]
MGKRRRNQPGREVSLRFEDYRSLAAMKDDRNFLADLGPRMGEYQWHSYELADEPELRDLRFDRRCMWERMVGLAGRAERLKVGLEPVVLDPDRVEEEKHSRKYRFVVDRIRYLLDDSFLAELERRLDECALRAYREQRPRAAKIALATLIMVVNRGLPDVPLAYCPLLVRIFEASYLDYQADEKARQAAGLPPWIPPEAR